ncbi:MAG: efflux RND transporter permease subunit [Pontibacterium sp.]
MNKHSTYRGIIPWFTCNPVAANLLMFLVICLGIYQMGDIRKEAFPSPNPDSVEVWVGYSSGSAKQAEEGIAIKIEDAITGITGIESVETTSTASGVAAEIDMMAGYDIDELLQDVEAAVNSISNFPADADRPVIEKDVRESHALWVQLYGESDRTTMQDILYRLQTDLLADPNINSVSTSGWLDPMLAIEVDEAHLQAYGLTLSDIDDAISASSVSANAATLSNKDTSISLDASTQAYYAPEFANIPILTLDNGQQILLRDVATVADTFDDSAPVLSRFNGQSAVGLEVIATGQDDISDTVVATQKIVDQWNEQGRIPEGLTLGTWSDSSTSINDRLELLISNAVMGVMFVFVLLAVFLNLTVAFWVAMGLPFIFFGALYVMGDNLLGLTLNPFTTFGFIMALGIVVDDAVVIGESIYDTRAKDGDTLTNTIRGTLKVATPTLFGVFTTVIAFFALSMVEGRLGEIYAQFAALVTICLLFSVVESKLILPSHLAHLNTRRDRAGNVFSRLWQSIQNGADAGLQWFNQVIYAPVIKAALNYRYAVITLFVAVFMLVITMPMTGAIRFSFFPQIPGDSVRASLTMQTGTSYGLTHLALVEVEKAAYAADALLREEAGDTSSEDDIKNMQVSSSSNTGGRVELELESDAAYDIQTFTTTMQRLAGLPEGAKTLSVRNSRGPISAFRAEIRGTNDDDLTQGAQMLREYLQGLEAVSGIDDNFQSGSPQISVELNEQGRALGLTTQTLAQQLLASFKGDTVQSFQRNNSEIDVVVRYPESDRQNPANVLDASVRTPAGDIVQVGSVANITYGFSQDSITRIQGKKAIYMSADVNKDLLSSSELVSQLQNDFVPQMTALIPSLSIEFAGEAREQETSQNSMIQLFALAMLGIYILLAIPLSSYSQPVIIMTAIPFGIVGALLGHWMNDLSLGILSLNGIIALSGVVVNDSLLLVSTYNRLRQSKMHAKNAIAQACQGRLRAVLLTSITTFAGLVPLISETSIQAQFLIPAAVSLGYGIMFATVITLILIPSLLMIEEDVRVIWRKIKPVDGIQQEPNHAQPATH